MIFDTRTFFENESDSSFFLRGGISQEKFFKYFDVDIYIRCIFSFHKFSGNLLSPGNREIENEKREKIHVSLFLFD